MKIYSWEELSESQDFEHGQEFVTIEDAMILMDDESLNHIEFTKLLEKIKT